MVKMMEYCAALTVAGSDSGGGAGIQADLKTFSALGVFGTSAITAVTAQNLDGVAAIQPIDPQVVRKQMIAVLKGFPIKAIKTGMLFSADIIEALASVLDEYHDIPVVIDPVFAATSGSKLIRDEAIDMLKNRLFPKASLITPNIPEAELLWGESIEGTDGLEAAARDLYEATGVPVVVKGGHLTDFAFDVLVDGEGMKIFHAELISGVNNHGSGCTFAAAIAAFIARGKQLRQAVPAAKEYIIDTLRFPVKLSADLKVMNHFFEGPI